MAERCVCGHDYWDHDPGPTLQVTRPTLYLGSTKCHGDLGGCECEEFTYLGEDDDEQTGD